jgi:hypothetical protein
MTSGTRRRHSSISAFTGCCRAMPLHRLGPPPAPKPSAGFVIGHCASSPACVRNTAA